MQVDVITADFWHQKKKSFFWTFVFCRALIAIFLLTEEMSGSSEKKYIRFSLMWRFSKTAMGFTLGYITKFERKMTGCKIYYFHIRGITKMSKGTIPVHQDKNKWSSSATRKIISSTQVETYLQSHPTPLLAPSESFSI